MDNVFATPGSLERTAELVFQAISVPVAHRVLEAPPHPAMPMDLAQTPKLVPVSAAATLDTRVLPASILTVAHALGMELQTMTAVAPVKLHLLEQTVMGAIPTIITMLAAVNTVWRRPPAPIMARATR